MQYLCPPEIVESAFFLICVENSQIIYLNAAKYKVVPLEIKNRV